LEKHFLRSYYLPGLRPALRMFTKLMDHRCNWQSDRFGVNTEIEKQGFAQKTNKQNSILSMPMKRIDRFDSTSK